jgi:hypothetical protein
MIYINLVLWLSDVIGNCIILIHILKKEINIVVLRFLLIILLILDALLSWIDYKLSDFKKK